MREWIRILRFRAEYLNLFSTSDCPHVEFFGQSGYYKVRYKGRRVEALVRLYAYYSPSGIHDVYIEVLNTAKGYFVIGKDRGKLSVYVKLPSHKLENIKIYQGKEAFKQAINRLLESYQTIDHPLAQSIISSAFFKEFIKKVGKKVEELKKKGEGGE